MEELVLCASSTGKLGVKRGGGALVIQYTPHTLIAAFRLEMHLSYSGSDNRASVTSEPEQITTTPEQAKSADALRSYHDRHSRSEVRPAMSSTRHRSSRFLLMSSRMDNRPRREGEAAHLRRLEQKPTAPIRNVFSRRGAV